MLASLESLWLRRKSTRYDTPFPPRDLFTHFEVSLRPIVRANTQSSRSIYLFGARIIQPVAQLNNLDTRDGLMYHHSFLIIEQYVIILKLEWNNYIKIENR